MRLRWLLLILPLASGLYLATPAPGILLETGNVNESAPPDPPGDPGWDHVGLIAGLNGVYVGHGWVLSAAHVNVTQGAFLVDGAPYPLIPQSRVVFQHQPGVMADLAAVRVQPYPHHLEPLDIIGATPPIGAEVLLVGSGAYRGAPIDWLYDGWYWGQVNGTRRWGTNHVGGYVVGVSGTIGTWPFSSGGLITQSLVTQFDPNGSAHEGVATVGDSGGALFARAAPTDPWRLAGIQWAITLHSGQPYSTSVYGNDTLSADLGFYRQAVLAVIRPCLDGADNDADGVADVAGVDVDGDTVLDLAPDPGCLWEGDASEVPACSDGKDDDWDGSTDLADSDCAAPTDPLEEPDLDADVVPDGRDNCQDIVNPSQLDTNADGYGNACDADVSNDGAVGLPDFGLMLPALGASPGEPDYDPDLDLDGDTLVGIPDFLVMQAGFGALPGPSGLTCAGVAPCP